MEEARVVIDLKEGVIELQGPVDFVRHYLEIYQRSIKGLQVSPGKAAAGPEKPARLLITTSLVPKYLGFHWMEQVENAPGYRE